jgi:hypothetical protein
MQYFQYIANDNARREREVQLANKFNQKPLNTFRKPPKFKRTFHVIEWIIFVGFLAGVLLLIIS